MALFRVARTAVAVTCSLATPAVIFRLDDVQDYYLASASRDVIGVFVDEGVPLSIGVIGGLFFGSDSATVEVVTNARAHHNHEVINHGPDGSSLFDTFTKEQAVQKIQEGEVPAFKPYTSFVPHEQRWANSTVEALEELDYAVLSAAADHVSFTQPVDLTASPMWLPQAAQTASFWNSSGVWEWESGTNTILEICAAQVAAHGVCVVMMHPQEFEYDVVTLAELRDIIIAVQDAGWTVKTFRQFALGDWAGTVSLATRSATDTTTTMALAAVVLAAVML